MAWTKTIVCLANSKKYAHRCIAGKEWRDHKFGAWIRPITQRDNGELTFDEMSFQNGDLPQLLDVVRVPLLQHAPHAYQSENYLIDHGYYWVKIGTLAVGQIPKLCDYPDSLWINGHHSRNGCNDAVPVELAETCVDSSLFLIHPSALRITVAPEKYGRKVRAEFMFRQQQYKFAVTDPLVEEEYLGRHDGTFRLDNSPRYLCVSLGEPFRGLCYKLVAAIIPFP